MEGILISHITIQERIRAMCGQIAEDYKDKDLYALVVLKGAIPFFTELLFNSNMTLPFEYGPIKVSSYEGTKSKTLRVEQFDFNDVTGKDVLLVEDILDTGNTLSHLLQPLQQSASSVRTAVLLDKPERREKPINADYIGFTIPNVFVVGYGMDFNNRFRYLQHIGVLKKSMYEK